MPKNNELLLIGGGALLLYMLSKQNAPVTAPLPGGTAIQPAATLIYTITDASVTFQGLTPVLVLTLSVSNPGNVPAGITNMQGSLASNGNNLGSIASFTPITVPPMQSNLINVTVNMSLVGAASDIINLITNQSGNPISIGLTGVAIVNGQQQPFNLTYSISF